MAITSSGEISFQAIVNEFGLGGNINAYYRADPFLPIISSGQFSYSNFYSADGRTAEIYTQHSADGFSPIPPSGRSGWSVARGSGYVYGGESAVNLAAFGSTTKIIPLSTGQNIQALYCQDQTLDGGSGTPRRSVVLTKRGSGNTATTGGFTSIRFRYNNSGNAYGLPGTSTTNYEVVLTRATATGFANLGSATVVGSDNAYAWYWTTTSLANSNISSVFHALQGNEFSAGGRNYVSIKIIY